MEKPGKKPYAMTNAIHREMTHTENPHDAPTPGFGVASRFDEGKTASAKPRRGAWLTKMSAVKGWLFAIGVLVAGASPIFAKNIVVDDGGTTFIDLKGDDNDADNCIVFVGSGTLTLTNPCSGEIPFQPQIVAEAEGAEILVDATSCEGHDLRLVNHVRVKGALAVPGPSVVKFGDTAMTTFPMFDVGTLSDETSIVIDGAAQLAKAIRRLSIAPAAVLKVVSGGTFAVDAAAGDALSAAKLLLDDATAKVRAGEGVVLSFDAVEVGGEAVPDGIYTSDNLDWFEGAGSVQIGAAPGNGAWGWSNHVTVAGVTYGLVAFTNSAQVFTWSVPAWVTEVDVLAVGGGGAGGAAKYNTVYCGAGGGGAGAFIYKEGLAVAPGQTFTVKVGKGGVSSTTAVPGDGEASVVVNEAANISLTAVGGGHGGGCVSGGSAGASGGCGGGGYGDKVLGGDPVGDGRGTIGGTGAKVYKDGGTSLRGILGGGGGGAGFAGYTPNGYNGCSGGDGLFCRITGESVCYGGGGGGGAAQADNGNTGNGGAGGGGQGGDECAGKAGTDGLGGGGGGGSSTSKTTVYAGGKGGSGVVIIRYAVDMGTAAVPSNLSPNGTQIAVHNAKQKEFLAMSESELRSAFGDSSWRDTISEQGDCLPLSVAFSWTGGGLNTVKVYNADGTLFLEKTVRGNSTELWGFDIGTNYTWEVVNSEKGASVRAAFTTELEVPRMFRDPNFDEVTFDGASTCTRKLNGVINMRELGGYVGLEGRRIRTGRLIRTARITENSLYSRDPGKSIGDSFVKTDAARAFWLDTLGIKTQVDLRDPDEYGSDYIHNEVGVFGPSVRWVKFTTANDEQAIPCYDKIFTTQGKANYKRLLDEMLNPANHPLVFHSSAGKDRVGTVAYILEAILGVGDEDKFRDWVALVLTSTDMQFSPAEAYDSFVAGFGAYDGETQNDKVVSFVKSLGIDDAQIDGFRNAMLEAGSEPPEPFVIVDYLAPETNEVGDVVFVERVTNAVPVTAEMRELTGGWYAVLGDVVIPAGERLVVKGEAHLILCDGASLKIEAPGQMQAAVKTTAASLAIYGQGSGSGMLVAAGGGADPDSRGSAGIGGDVYGAGGTVTIHGGTVTATGGTGAVGIGGGYAGAGGSVTITGGRIAAQGGEGAEDIGSGANAKTPCAVSISGGIFAREPQPGWLAFGYAVVANADVATKGAFPWTIQYWNLPLEDYYDTSDNLVQSFPIGKVRTVDYAPTAEEIAAADAAIGAAGGSGPKLAPPLAVQNEDGTLTIIRGGIVANRLIRRFGNLPPETTIPMRVVGVNRETMLMNSAYDPNVPEKTWMPDDFGEMAVVTNFQYYVRGEENWQQNMTNQMDRLYRLADAATNDFTQAFLSVTNLLGRSDGSCRDTLKGRGHAYAETVANMPETGGWPNVNSIYDVFGCTFVLGDEDDFAKAIALVGTEFEKCGFRVVRIQNGYYVGSVTTSGYADVRVNVRHENGFTGEIILVEANMNREKMEGVAHEVYEIRRDYDASMSAAKDGDLQKIMDELDHLMRLVQFNPREGDSHDQFQKTYGYLVQNLPNLRDGKYAEIWSANTRAHLEDYIARIRDPVMYDGYRARRTELAARTDEVRVGMALGSEAKSEAAVRALPGRRATIAFDEEGLPVIGVDDGDDAGVSVWGKDRLTDAWWVTPHEPSKHHFFRVTERE